MTSREEFEKWWKEQGRNYLATEYAPACLEAWQASQADQAEYIAMLELNNKFKDDANQKLRDALEFCTGTSYIDDAHMVAEEALKEKNT